MLFSEFLSNFEMLIQAVRVFCYFLMIKQVLCIDDDLITLKLLEFNIKSQFFAGQVFKFSGAEDALVWLQNNAPSTPGKESFGLVVFLDLSLPGLNGWQFLNLFLRDHLASFPESKVVILSASVSDEDLLKAKDYGIVIDFIPKPMRANDIQRLKENVALKRYFITDPF